MKVAQVAVLSREQLDTAIAALDLAFDTDSCKLLASNESDRDKFTSRALLLRISSLMRRLE